MSIVLGEHKNLTVNVRIDSYRGRIISSVDIDAYKKEASASLNCGVTGRHAVYFEFLSKEEGAVAEFDRFSFD